MVGKSEVHEFLEVQKKVEVATEYADKFNKIGSDGATGSFESVIAQTRMRFADPKVSAVITSSPEFDEFLIGFLKENDVEIAQRTIMYAAEVLAKEQSEAVEELAKLNLTPLPVILAPKTFTEEENVVVQFDFVTAYMVKYPATFALKTGSVMPTGLALSSDGEVTGTPTIVGKTVVEIETSNEWGTVNNKITFDIRPV